MNFQTDFFKQILGIVMGTNLAPALANIYMAMFEEELKIRVMDDGFGTIYRT